jgi:molybdopterin synthase sulfur carrier subunit
MMRVMLPQHLRTLARVGKEVTLPGEDITTLGLMLDALEAQYPMLRGTIRDYQTQQRRQFIRFFACGLDLSHQSLQDPLPAEVVAGSEPLRVVGAMAGG